MGFKRKDRCTKTNVADGDVETPVAAIEVCNGEGIAVSTFDYSVDNYFKAMDMVAELSGEKLADSVVPSEIERLSSSITFLREWRHFNYPPRTIRFSTESPHEKHLVNKINLPQFSSATVPKERPSEGSNYMETGKDFVLNAGGHVWALDWCPRDHKVSNNPTKCEFIAVAAHPPESSYHKLGCPLTGRGVVQIWCLLNVSIKGDETLPSLEKLKRGRVSIPRKDVMQDEGTPKKQRGRPKRKPLDEASNSLKFSNQSDEGLLLLHVPESASKLDAGGASMQLNESVALENQQRALVCINKPELNDSTQQKKPRDRPRKKPVTESLNATVHVPDSSSKLATAEIPMNTNGHADPESQQEASVGTGKYAVNESTSIKKPRGRPRMKPVNESLSNLNSCNQSVPLNANEHALIENQQGSSMGMDEGNANKSSKSTRSSGRTREKLVNKSLDNFFQPINLQCAGNPSKSPAECFSMNTNKHEIPESQQQVYVDTHESDEDERRQPNRLRGRKRKMPLNESPNEHALSENLDQASGFDDEQYVSANQQKEQNGFKQEEISKNDTMEVSCNEGSSTLIPKDVALPKVVLCLAHNGKVAWDVKWQPSSAYSSEGKHRMGYLAVILGNGSLEVWDVPLPHATKFIYSSLQGVGTDPRFVKLEPVFRCSKLKSGNIQSIPLTVEWSTAPPHNFLLAGCHDGMVTLWKFSANDASKDTRPILCFTADTAPIRALSWAPDESDGESANVIVTAGHGGLKFWDIRDPYRPLCGDIIPSAKIVYSLDWVPYLRCVLMSLDDGTIKKFSLESAAYDVPVTGKAVSKSYGLNTFNCSSYAIWSVQVSRLTGMVAYCSADGNAFRFQLTAKAKRYPAPHLLCGSLTEEESTLTVNTQICAQGPAKAEKKKKGENKISDALNICDDDSSAEEVEESVTARKKTKLLLPAACSKKMVDRVHKTEEPIIAQAIEAKKEAETKVEVITPKMVAMHRVRWNNNIGSHKWLCYGGAAGIVRCQKMNFE